MNCVDWCKQNFCGKQFDLGAHEVTEPNQVRPTRPKFKFELEPIPEESQLAVSTVSRTGSIRKSSSIRNSINDLRIDSIIQALEGDSSSPGDFRTSLRVRMTRRSKCIHDGKTFLKPKNRYQQYPALKQKQSSIVKVDSPDENNFTIHGYRLTGELYRSEFCSVKQAVKDGQHYALKIYYKNKISRLVLKAKDKSRPIWINGLYLAQRQAVIGLDVPKDCHLLQTSAVLDDESLDQMYLVSKLLDKPFISFNSDTLKFDHSHSEQELKRLMGQLAKAVAGLHSRGIVHKDIKPANIMLDSLGKLFLLDYSQSSYINNPIFQRSSTLLYTPPEILADMPQINQLRKAWDVWSYGCVLFNAVYKKMPFMGDTGQALLKAIGDGLDYGHGGSPELVQLMMMCLERTPERRAKIEEVVTHGWLKC